jgi:hypothetical protein
MVARAGAEPVQTVLTRPERFIVNLRVLKPKA